MNSKEKTDTNDGKINMLCEENERLKLVIGDKNKEIELLSDKYNRIYGNSNQQIDTIRLTIEN